MKNRKHADIIAEKMINIIIPCYNEEIIISESVQRIKSCVEDLPYTFSYTFINDGSADNTLSILKNICSKNDNCSFISFSRNFGKEAALMAGFDNFKGDALLILDADLQDPPELIKEFLEEWDHKNYDIVYGKREKRSGETWFKKITAYCFYRIINTISFIQLPVDAGDFWLIDKRVVGEIIKLRENHRYTKGLLSWVGFKRKAVLYKREKRIGGKSKFNIFQLINLSIEAFTGYSLAPLKIITILGFVVSFFSFIFGVYTITKALVFGVDTPGYTSTIAVLCFLSGIQLLSLGVMGEYIGRIFNEAKKRSPYIVEESSISDV